LRPFIFFSTIYPELDSAANPLSRILCFAAALIGDRDRPPGSCCAAMAVSHVRKGVTSGSAGYVRGTPLDFPAPDKPIGGTCVGSPVV
jgi:hypothetical protein